jgi:predicted lactoylglutathione lyase
MAISHHGKRLYSFIFFIIISKIFINLPVINIDNATNFYEAIGFVKNSNFSNTSASGMVYDDNLTIMLLTHEFAKSFLPTHKSIADSFKTCEVLNALQFDSKEQVDNFVQKALNTGAKLTIPPYDHGFVYGKDFEDLDGHIWEAFWMDANYTPTQN